jgi:hypothetical protein
MMRCGRQQTATAPQPGQLTAALLDTATDTQRVGVIDATAHAKIALWHLRETAQPSLEPLHCEDVR